MAVYQKLLLTTGGGIISNQQQADQTKNTATILIGLGGTGVHCIRTIKSQVYSRLKPDNVKAVIPSYSHIRFLGIDTTEKSRGGVLAENQTLESKKNSGIMSLSDTEFFSIANKQVAQALSNPLALKQKPELDWLDYENIKVPNLTDAGAGGIRQVGRFMMMDKSEEFMSRVEQEINAAKSGLTAPRVNIHVFAGLSGGTGSGCFLDVCYMIRSLAVKMGGVTIFGYFFLPDVNLSVIPHENVDVRNYIPKNGYAAMQELDYCMCLQQNGGRFHQAYKGHKVLEWYAPPVDMAHLICATDKDNNVIPDAYNYAMNVTAEYVMDFLTDSSDEFGLTEHLSNFQQMVTEADSKKTIGSNMAYCVIGASCASIPLREINTYLASELFNAFGSIRVNTPTQNDVAELAVRALSKEARTVGEIYDSLKREIRRGAEPDYAQFPGDWKDVRDYGNHELVTHYTDQTARKLNKAETNAKSMMSDDNQLSLIGRIRDRLLEVLQDINRGPIFGYKMISAAESHNLINIIDGLIQDNDARWSQESAQSQMRKADYDNAKMVFDNRTKRGIRDNDQKRFADYEFYLMIFEQHKLEMNIYEKLSQVLKKLKEQVLDVTASYYIKLKRVMETLLDTFAENKEALASNKPIQTTGNFEIPMMTIKELKPSLDDEIHRVNIPNMMSEFVRMIVENEEEWIAEDENKIAHLVTEFFVVNAFAEFAGKTITGFLKDKYENQLGGSINDETLTELIYEEWMKKLTAKASPLFYFNSSIWAESQTSNISFLSFPKISSPIKNAAQKMHETSNKWGIKASALTDRIFIMSSACGLPLSSYNNCQEYERMFFSAKSSGRHYYEGKPVEGMKVDNWNLLPSITPQSVINVNLIPADLAELVTKARDLYDQAKDLGVLSTEGYVCTPSAEILEKLQSGCEAAQKAIASASKPEDVIHLGQIADNLKKIRGQVTMTSTGFKFPEDGYRKDADSINSLQKDHFVSSPAIQLQVADIVDQMGSKVQELNEVIAAAENKANQIRTKGSMMGDYCEAVFTGVLAIEGRMMVFHKSTYGINEDIIFSKRGEEFPYASIPVYQGYLTYQKQSDEFKAEVREMVNTHMDNETPEMLEAGKKLKAMLSTDQVTAWNQLAGNFVEAGEINSFLADFMKRFHTHSLNFQL